MRFHARTLLTGATLTLLAIGFGVSNAAAAPKHAAATVHKIWKCGYVATKPGVYSLARSVTDSGDGPCITLNGNKITLFLEAHTITGTGTDTCLDVEGDGSKRNTDELIVGGTAKRPANLTGCKRGLNVNFTARTHVRYLKIAASTSFAVFTSDARNMVLKDVNVRLAADAVAGGIHLEHGKNNLVTQSTVVNNSAYDAFFAEAETDDSFTYDVAKATAKDADVDGDGFHEYECARDTYFHDMSLEQFDGFDLDESGSGAVYATYNTATGPSDTESSYGIFVGEAYDIANPASTFRTLVANNRMSGFQDDFYDTTADRPSVVPERWIDNTADNYVEYGFYIYYPMKYTLTGNVADGNTSGKKYAGGSTDGFYFEQASADQPFAAFSKNAAYDSEYGYYSNGDVVSGKNNVSKRNKYRPYDVTING